LGENRAVDEAVSFEFTQMLREHFLRRTRDQSLQFTETVGSIFQVKQDERLPLATDDFRREFHRAIDIVHGILLSDTR